MSYLSSAMGPLDKLRPQPDTAPGVVCVAVGDSADPNVDASRSQEGNVATRSQAEVAAEMRAVVQDMLKTEFGRQLEAIRFLLVCEFSKIADTLDEKLSRSQPAGLAHNHHKKVSQLVASDIMEERPTLLRCLTASAGRLGDSVPKQSVDRDESSLDAKLRHGRDGDGCSPRVSVAVPVSCEKLGAESSCDCVYEVTSKLRLGEDDNQQTRHSQGELAQTLVTKIDEKLKMHFSRIEQLVSGAFKDSRHLHEPDRISDAGDLSAILGLQSARRKSVASSNHTVMGDFFPGPLGQVDLFEEMVSPTRDPDKGGEFNFEPKDKISMRTCTAVASMLLVILNAIFLGLAEDQSLRAAIRGEPEPPWIWYTHLGFAIAFVGELLARLHVDRRDFFIGKEKYWNLFDVVLICTSWLDLASADIGMSAGRLLRALRVLRVLQILRRLGQLRYMRLMVTMILGSALPFLWAMVLLCLCIYIVSIFTLQGVASRVMSSEPVDTSWLHDVLKYCQGLPNMMSTIISILSGGLDSKEFFETLEAAGAVYRPTMILFMLFVSLILMNIVTATFVCAAQEVAYCDDRVTIQAQLHDQRSTTRRLQRLLQGGDTTQKTLTREKLNRLMSRADVRRCLENMELEKTDLTSVFQLVDIDGLGEVYIADFVTALLRLKGFVNSFDVLTLVYANRRLNNRIDAFMHSSASALAHLATRLPSRLATPAESGQVRRARRKSKRVRTAPM